jgi:hypothetical protein
MDSKLSELTSEELARLPGISNRNWIGEEKVYLHLYNSKKMNWYLAEYDPVSRKFFGFSENRSEGIIWGEFYLADLLSLSKKGSSWEILSEGKWTPVYSKEIPSLQGYIGMIISLPDIV